MDIKARSCLHHIHQSITHLHHYPSLLLISHSSTTESLKMQLISSPVLAFAILSCGLISTTLAAPTPQMVTMGGDDGQTSVKSRQCVGHFCASSSSEDKPASVMLRQIWSKIKESTGQESRFPDDRIIFDARRSSTQSRQLHSGQMASEGAVENRQVMHAMGAEEGDTQIRQVHGGFMAEDGQDVESRQLMHSSNDDDGVVAMESRQIAAAGEEDGDIRSRQVMHSSSDEDGVTALKNRQIGASDQGPEDGDLRARQVLHSPMTAPSTPSKEELIVWLKQLQIEDFDDREIVNFE